jgi:hypothetical protein
MDWGEYCLGDMDQKEKQLTEKKNKKLVQKRGFLTGKDKR